MVSLVETWTNELCDLNVPGYDHRVMDQIAIIMYFFGSGSNHNVPGYDHLCLHRTKSQKARRSSGGIVVYFKCNLTSYISQYKHLMIMYYGYK